MRLASTCLNATRGGPQFVTEAGGQRSLRHCLKRVGQHRLVVSHQHCEGTSMRKLMFLFATGAALVGAVGWWRQHRRASTRFANRIVNPWLERSGVIGSSRGELGLIEHVGRRSGIVRRTPIHPMPIVGGFRIIVPVGERSEWARNVLAAGHCRLLLGDRVVELDEPMLELPADVPDLSGARRALFGWLGFRYLRLRTFGELPADVAPTAEPTESQRELAVA